MVNFFVLVLLLSLMAIPVGLINPQLFQKLIQKLLKKDATRKNVLASLTSLVVVSFFGVGVTAPAPIPQNEEQEVELAEEVQALEAEEPILEKTVEVEEPASTTIKTEEKEEVRTAQPEVDEPEVTVQQEITTSSSTSNSEAYSVEETPEPVYEEPAAPSTWYSCNADIYNCSNFSTHAEAQSVYEGCLGQVGYDVHGLDGNDNDGLACESLP